MALQFPRPFAQLFVLARCCVSLELVLLREVDDLTGNSAVRASEPSPSDLNLRHHVNCFTT